MSVLELFGVEEPGPKHKVYRHLLTTDLQAKTPHVWDLLGSSLSLDLAVTMAKSQNTHAVVLDDKGQVIHNNGKPPAVHVAP